FERAYGWVALIAATAGGIAWMPYWTIILLPAAFAWRAQGDERVVNGQAFAAVIGTVLLLTAVTREVGLRIPILAPLTALAILGVAWYSPGLLRQSEGARE